MGKEILTPMPGKIIDILVKESDEIQEGQEVIIIEAMKMENAIVAENSGKVKEILIKVNDTVSVNQPLLVVE